jgi:MFS family permease
VATSLATFLAAIELTSIGTALPTIVKDIGGAGFIWIGAAYALASAAFMPASGSLSNIFGRQPVMLTSIAFFAVGSALGGAAKNMKVLIAARGKGC